MSSLSSLDAWVKNFNFSFEFFSHFIILGVITLIEITMN